MTSLASDFSREVHCLLGLPFDAVDLDGAVCRIDAAKGADKPCLLTTPNLNFVVACRADPDFRDTVLDSDLVIADGMPLVWVARLLGLPLRQRVAGSDLFEALRRRLDPRLAVYFFGGPQGAAEAARERLNAQPGGLFCVGCACPGFGTVAEMSGPELIEPINASGADFLVVSLGARKGQAWISANRPRLRVPVVSHLGAVVNYVAETVRRAPDWMQQAGLEWLWRIKEEPALWRRYGKDGAVFAYLFFTRILPYARFLRQARPRLETRAGTARIDTAADFVRIRLQGAWGRDNLQAFRDCLNSSDLAGKDVHLDLQAVSYGDSAFVGLLLLLHRHQHRQGRQLRLDPVSPPVRRILRYSCAEYLLPCPA